MKTYLVLAGGTSVETREAIATFVNSAEGYALHPSVSSWMLPHLERPGTDAATILRDQIGRLTGPNDVLVVIEICGGWSALGLTNAT